MTPHFWLNIPNFITLCRIISVPFLVWLVLANELKVAFWVFIIAGLSDALDGFLAKLMKSGTTIGAYLDPIADKFLIVSVFVILGVEGYLPSWLIIMVVFRDLAIVVGAGLIELITKDLKMSPNFSSKINTVVQIVLASVVLGVYGLNISGLQTVIDMLVYITALTTALSGMIYLYQWGNTISKENGE